MKTLRILQAGGRKKMKTEILCNVHSCVFHTDDDRCQAKTISVTCDRAIQPHCFSETACQSFRCKNEQ